MYMKSCILQVSNIYSRLNVKCLLFDIVGSDIGTAALDIMKKSSEMSHVTVKTLTKMINIINILVVIVLNVIVKYINISTHYLKGALYIYILLQHAKVLLVVIHLNILLNIICLFLYLILVYILSKQTLNNINLKRLFKYITIA